MKSPAVERWCGKKSALCPHCWVSVVVYVWISLYHHYLPLELCPIQLRTEVVQNGSKVLRCSRKPNCTAACKMWGHMSCALSLNMCTRTFGIVAMRRQMFLLTSPGSANKQDDLESLEGFARVPHLTSACFLIGHFLLDVYNGSVSRITGSSLKDSI